MFKSLIIIKKPLNKFNIMPRRPRRGGVFAYIKKWGAAIADYGKNATKCRKADAGARAK
jgi:hypothetical protein